MWTTTAAHAIAVTVTNAPAPRILPRPGGGCRIAACGPGGLAGALDVMARAWVVGRGVVVRMASLSWTRLSDWIPPSTAWRVGVAATVLHRQH